MERDSRRQLHQCKQTVLLGAYSEIFQITAARRIGAHRWKEEPRKFVSRPTLLPEGVCDVLMISVLIASAEILDSRNFNFADYVIAKSVKPNQYKINLPIIVKRLHLSAKCTPLWTMCPNNCRQDIAPSTTSGEYHSSSKALYSFLSDPTSSQQLRGDRFVFSTDADISPLKTFPTWVLESST